MSYLVRLGLIVTLALGLAFVAAPGRADESAAPAALEIGKPAPRFRLNDQAGEVHDPLAGAGERKRWVVLAFFPKAMTPG